MNNNNHIDPFDETLRLFFLESAKSNDENAEKELAMILSNDNPALMPDMMRLNLMVGLEKVLDQTSLGQLIKDAIQKNTVEESTLVQHTGIPLPVLKELEEDALYTNNVPIVLLRNLLKTLNISFHLAKAAIRRTFDLLQLRGTSSTSHNGLTPTFKKGGFSSRETFFRNAPKGSGKELFQNEEALNRYLNRLDELMND
jgi:hypothetical protein